MTNKAATHHRLLFGFLLLLLSPATSVHARSINWGSNPGSLFYSSDGSPLGDNYIFELGTFATSFTPIESNMDLWATNWTPFDRATAPDTSGWNSSAGLFSSTATLLPDGSSSAFPTSLFAGGEQAYLWAYRDNQTLSFGGEWALVSSPTWILPSPTDQTSTALDWQLSDATNIVFGAVNNTQGPGTRSNDPATLDLQTHSTVPEPSSALLATFAAAALLLQRRRRQVITCLALLACTSLSLTAQEEESGGGNPIGLPLSAPIVQSFIIPLPEEDFRSSIVAIGPTTATVGTSMRTIISIVVPNSGTIITYDQWEDGHEADSFVPGQTSTLIWGDGNAANGTAPGYPTDVLPAGGVITLNNLITLPRNPVAVVYDARDLISATKAIAVNKAGWAISPGTVIATATEVYDIRKWGTAFKTPIGTDTAASIQLFEYSSLYIVAAEAGTTVSVDKDHNGSIDQTATLGAGETLFVNGGVLAGADITSSAPIQVHQLTGDIGSTYESRTFAIRPTAQWATEYYAPVGTTSTNTQTHNVFLYNPATTDITVNYETTSTTGSLTVPANGTAQYTIPLNSGAHFFCDAGSPYYAIGANDSGSAATANATQDWGYALLPATALTTEVTIGFGPGADDLTAPVGPDANGSPVWVTPTATTTVYVNLSGDYSTGPNTAPDGRKYDVAYPINHLASQRITDTADNDMTKARLFTTDGTRLAAAWGEDTSTAGPGAPYLDMGTTIIPFPLPIFTKTASLVTDLNNDELFGIGDVVEFTLSLTNDGLVDLPDTLITDTLPAGTSYLPGTTRLNASAYPDDTSGTPFPIDGSGILIPGGLATAATVSVKFHVTLTPGSTSVTNTASATSSGLERPLTTSVTFTVQPGPSLSGSVFQDTNALTDNLVSGTGTNLTNSLYANLTDGLGTLLASTPVAANGSYSFTNLSQNTTYTVVIATSPTATTPSLPATWVNTGEKLGSGTGHDGSANGSLSVPIVTAAVTQANFGIRQTATLTGHLYLDTNGNGSQDPTEPPLPNISVLITDSEGSGQTVSTDSNGDWVATVPPGSTTADINTADTDFTALLPSGSTQTQGTDPTTTTTVAGTSQNGGTDGFAPPALYTISGQVRFDSDHNGNFLEPDPPLADFTIRLYRDNNSNGQIDPGDTLITTQTTSASGTYTFPSQPNGPYLISQTPPNSSLYKINDGDGNNDRLIPIVLSNGNSTGNDFLEAADPQGWFYDTETGSVVPGGLITVTTMPPGGAITMILDGSSGEYAWLTNGVSGTYTMTVTPPSGYTLDPRHPAIATALDPTGQANPYRLGSEVNPSGTALLDPTPGSNPWHLSFDLASGDPAILLNNLPLLRLKPLTYSGWQTRNPLPGNNAPGQDPDLDTTPNFLEFAFCYNPSSGIHSSCPLDLTVLSNGTVHAHLRRVTDAIGITYQLEAIADLASSTSNGGGWTPITSIVPTVASNPDGSETATFSNITQLPFLATGQGFLRVKVTDTSSGGTIYRTTPLGWSTRTLTTACQTCGDPFLNCSTFTGSIDSLTASVLNLATSTGPTSLSAQLTPGSHYYLEVIAGDHLGHRLDLNEAATTATAAAIDTTSPFNTLTTLPPTLSGDTIAIRPHRTFGQTFPVSRFTATNNPSTADRILFTTPGSTAFSSYWLYQNSGSPRWVDQSLVTFGDVGPNPLAPGRGTFIHPKGQALSLILSGHVRSTAFAFRLPTGTSLLTPPWPLNQSPSAQAMTLANGFTGARARAQADTLQFWVGDTTSGSNAYASYYLVNFAAYQHWTPQANATLSNASNLPLLKALHAHFLRSISGKPDWLLPLPWTP